MKYLKIFETKTAFDADKSNLESPCVVLTEDDKNVHTIPTYEYVDLGLTSGLKWAKCNIGATSETDYGLYFQWGATKGYTAEQVQNGEKVFDFNTTPYQTNPNAGTSKDVTKFTKYLGSTTSSYKDPSATDEDAEKTVLDPIDDAATQLMGKDWRMPTAYEFYELLNDTTQTRVTNYNDSGINGFLLTSKNNKNTLFIPAAGLALCSSIADKDFGYVWSSSLYTAKPDDGYKLTINDFSCGINISGRYCGFPVRGVRK